MKESESRVPELFQQLLAVCQPLGRELCRLQTQKTQVILKEDDSPVTDADMLSHNTLVDYLPSIYQAPIVSEEAVPRERIFNDFWLIDPIDGTKEFIDGSDEFTVHIALFKDHKPYFGFVYVPKRGHAYAALVGGKAYKFSDGTWTIIQSSNKTKNLISTESRLHKNPKGVKVPQYDIQETVEQGSSLKILAIAEGKADIYIRALPTMIWDTVPPQIILQAAGGDIFDFQGNCLYYSLENLSNPPFQAVNAGILSKLSV